MQENRITISKLEIEKAKNALEEAKILFDSQMYYGAANRSYYAVFHAMSTLLILDGYSMKKHSGVMSKFREIYIKTGIFDISMSEKISALFRLRTDCDYDSFYVVSKQEVAEQFDNAAEMMKTLEERLIELT